MGSRLFLIRKMEEKLNIYKNSRCWANEEKRLEKADIRIVNKDLIRKYINEQFAKGSREVRCTKLSSQLRKIAALVDKDFNQVKRDDILSLLSTINKDVKVERILKHYYTGKIFNIKRKPLSYETKKDYWRLVKSFFTWLNKANKEIFEEIKFNGAKHNKTIGDIITEEDIQKVIKKCDCIRDRALLAVLHETGARAGELLNLKIKDIMRYDRFVKLRLNGKTGERRVIIVWSVPYLFRYLETHKYRDKPNNYLWISTHPRYKDKPLLHPGLRALLIEAFKKTGLEHKKHNPHYFRHSRATINAKFMTEVQMCLYFGWVIGTDQVATYVHASGRDVDDAILAMHGLKKKEDIKQPNAVKECAICKTINESISEYCKNCGQPLTLKKALEAEDKIKSETEKAFELLMEIAKSPEMMKEFEEFKEKAAIIRKIY